MVFQGSLKGVLIKYQECFMQVLRLGRFKDVLRKFQESFEEDRRVFLGIFEDVSRAFQRSYKAVYFKED